VASRSHTEGRVAKPYATHGFLAALAAAFAVGAAAPAFAQPLPTQQRLCDPTFDDCRAVILTYIQQETVGIDMGFWMMTDERQSNAMIAAVSRGVPVRLITDTTEYRNPDRLWDAYNVDKMYHAGVQVRVDAHAGINHEKAVLLHGLGMAILGSSNWTSPSSDSQREHNIFTTLPNIFSFLNWQFMRKWADATGAAETGPFVPLPPNAPVYNVPANDAVNVPTTGVGFVWYAGPWAHLYDIYIGTTPNPPLIAANQKLGPSQFWADYRVYMLPPLQPGTRDYWRIVSKTMAFVPAAGPVWTFQTRG